MFWQTHFQDVDDVDDVDDDDDDDDDDGGLGSSPISISHFFQLTVESFHEKRQ